MPLGKHRHISVYDRVIVGSDGSSASLFAVDRAHAVAAEADSHVIVVTAYDPDAGPDTEGGRQVLRDHDGAKAVLTATVKHLTSDRVRRVEERLVHGDPAQALLDTAGDDPAALIVVGNRGLGAASGEVLGAVPAAVVRDAKCDVLIVQVSMGEPIGAT
jgi:maltose/moltooligosaccharide transporter